SEPRIPLSRPTAMERGSAPIQSRRELTMRTNLFVFLAAFVTAAAIVTWSAGSVPARSSSGGSLIDTTALHQAVQGLPLPQSDATPYRPAAHRRATDPSPPAPR